MTPKQKIKIIYNSKKKFISEDTLYNIFALSLITANILILNYMRNIKKIIIDSCLALTQQRRPCPLHLRDWLSGHTPPLGYY